MRLPSYFYWTAQSQRTLAKRPQDRPPGDREQPGEGREGSGQGAGREQPSQRNGAGPGDHQSRGRMFQHVETLMGSYSMVGHVQKCKKLIL